jgi:hypothetical protein
MFGDKYWNRLNIPVEIDSIEYAIKLEDRWILFISKLGYKFEYELRVFVPDNLPGNPSSVLFTGHFVSYEYLLGNHDWSMPI